MSGLYWLASYPKSGNTWARCFLAALAVGGIMPDLDQLADIIPLSASRSWIEEVLDIPTSDLTPQELDALRREAHHVHAASPHPPRWFKVHDRYDPTLFPPEITAGIVYIVRDPRDVALSFAEHRSTSIEDTVKTMNRSDARTRAGRDYIPNAPQLVSSWSDHATSWLDQQATPVLLLRYEDMRTQPVEAFGRLATFLGLTPDSAVLSLAVEATRFDALRAQEAASGFRERPPAMKSFFRQGNTGTWRRDLHPNQAARVVSDHHSMMAKLSYL
jgi:aryl sulfotransferase